MQKLSNFLLLLLVLFSTSTSAQDGELDGSLRQRIDQAVSAVDVTDPDAVAQSVGKIIDANDDKIPEIVHYAVSRLSDRLGNQPDVAGRVIPAVTRTALRSALRSGSGSGGDFKRVLPPREDPDCPYPVVMAAVDGLSGELRPVVTPRILEAALLEIQDPRCRAKIMQSILATTDDRFLRNQLFSIATANNLAVDGNPEDFIGGDGFGQGVGNVGGVFPGAGGGPGTVGTGPTPAQPTSPPSGPTPPPPTPAPSS